MLKDKFISLINGNTAYGIDIYFDATGGIKFTSVELKLTKGEVVIVQQQKGGSIEKLLALDFSKNCPVYLNFKGKGVLSKKVTSSKGDNESELLRLALPNAKVDEFCFYSEAISENEFWVHFSRKNVLDQFLNPLKELGLSVFHIQLGYTALNTIESLFHKQVVVIDSNQLIFREGSLVQIIPSEKTETQIRLGDEVLSSNVVLAYACAFCHFTESGKLKLQTTDLEFEQEEFKQKKIFSLGLKFSLGFFLLVLLINFFAFQDYSKTFAQLSQKLELNQSQLDRLKQLESEKKNKEQFFAKTDLISASNNAYYADRLAVSKPDGLSWNELNVNPPKNKIERGEDIEFNIKTIDLKGITNNSSILNEWIASLKKEEWVQSINIKGFQKQERKKSSKFNLQILVK